MEQLSGKVLTVDVWRAEREAFELRFAQVTKDLNDLEVDVKTDREKARAAKKEADAAAAALRRQAVFAVLTSIVGPIATGVILALVLK